MTDSDVAGFALLAGRPATDQEFLAGLTLWTVLTAVGAATWLICWLCDWLQNRD